MTPLLEVTGLSVRFAGLQALAAVSCRRRPGKSWG